MHNCKHNMIAGEKFDAVLVYIFVTLVCMAGSGQSILSSSKQCPDSNCRCDSQRIDCNCMGTFQELTFNELSPTSVNDITIRNCDKVTITKNSIKNLKSLRHLNINNIRNLTLQDSSLYWCSTSDCVSKYAYGIYQHPSPAISIKNSTIHEIQSYAIKGEIMEIILLQVKIDRIAPFAFTSFIGMPQIEIKDSIVNGVQAQAFKKFNTKNLLITNTKVGMLPSRSFSDIAVTENFKIHNSQFEHIKPMGFIIKDPTHFEILKSQFNELEGDSFKIITKGGVTIKDNYFIKLHGGAFGGISNEKEARLNAPELLFINNTINEINKDTLLFNRSSFNIKLEQLILNRTCTCADIKIWTSNSIWVQQIHCTVQSGRSRIVTQAKDFKVSKCDSVPNTWIVIVSVIVGVLVILVIAIVVLIFVYKRYKKNKQKEYVNRGRNKNGSLGLIVPDGRTYRETELHVIVEKAELLTTEL